jgi:hypothetical protein
VLDLRGNPGGYLNAANNIVDELLNDGKLIVYTQGRAKPKQTYMTEKEGIFEEGKLAVLIDEGSASASEIVSGAIQDWDRGLIIGRRSFGKGLVQEPFELSDGSAIRLTIARYYTPSGRCIQKKYSDGLEKYEEDLMNRFENGELENARLLFSEALLLNIELNDNLEIFGSIHRLFSLMKDSEREQYYTLAKSLINESTKPNQLSIMANIELMQYCLSNKKVECEILHEKKLVVLSQKEKSTLSDLDDLPIEAFYCAALKSIEIGNEELAKEFAGYALNMIGELKSIRKVYFQDVMLQTANYRAQ